MDPLSALTEHPLFGEFTDDELRAIVADSQVRSYRPGERIIEAGTPGSFLGIVLEGTVQAETRDPDGRQHVLGEIATGEYFGEVSLVSGEKTTADVAAVSPCRVLQIPHHVMSEALATHPQAMQDVAKTIAERLSRETSRPTEAESAVAADVDADEPVARILTINRTENSLEYHYFDTTRETNNMSGTVTGVGTDHTVHTAQGLRWKETEAIGPTLDEVSRAVLDALSAGPMPSLDNLEQLTAVAHRVPHGGEKYTDALAIDSRTAAEITDLPGNLGTANEPAAEAIGAFRNALPDLPHIAVFDTAFFAKMPPRAFLYAVPYQWYTDDAVRRYGGRGLVHQQAALLAAAHLRQPANELNLITCELGPVPSVCAVRRGRAIDVSIGLTSLDGLPGATTCGDIDPSVLLRKGDMLADPPDEAMRILSENAGLAAIAGDTGNLAAITQNAEAGNERASLALDVFCYRLCKYIGAYAAALGSIEAIVFTGPAATDLPALRTRICADLHGLGIGIDPQFNASPMPDTRGVSDISEPDASTRVLVAPTDACRMASAVAAETVGLQNVAAAILAGRRPIPIGISVRHVHLSREHVDRLFGEDHRLTFRAPLTQPGQFACEETVDVIGPKRNVERVRVLGPERPATQVELSRTDCYQIGVQAPLRMSGHVDGTPGVELVGPRGRANLQQGAICARRHLHASPEEALMLGVRHGDEISVRIEGERSLVFGEVAVRVDPDYRLDMHIDTDEANAARLEQGSVGYVESVDTRA